MRICRHRGQQKPDHRAADPSHELAAQLKTLTLAYLVGHGARRKGPALAAGLLPLNCCILIRAFKRALSRGRPPGRRAMVSKLVTTGKMDTRVRLFGARFIVDFLLAD
jgi:hypothetical protein